MKSDLRRKQLIFELEQRADVYEKFYKEGSKFYDDICKRYHTACLEELTTSQLITELDRLYESDESPSD